MEQEMLGKIFDKLDGIETRLDGLETGLADVKGTVETLDGRIKDLDKKVETLNEHVVGIEKELHDMRVIHENIVPNQVAISKNTTRIEKLEEVTDMHDMQIRGLQDRVSAR